MRNLFFIFFLFVSTGVFSQKSFDINNISIELNGGKFFTKTTYILRSTYFSSYYTGKVNLNLLLYYPLTKNIDISIDQNYARMSNEDLNNRNTLHLTTFNINSCLYSKNKFNFKLSFGFGFETIHIKNLNDFYPFVNNIYGIPIKVIISLNYKLSDKLTVLCNSDLIYSFFFYNKYLVNNPDVYYQASFNSINLGLRYYFGKKQKNNEK